MYKPLSLSVFYLSVFYALSVPLSQTTGSMSGSSKATKECPCCHEQFAVRGLSSHQKKCELEMRLKQEDRRRSQQIYTRLCIPGALNSLSMVSKLLILCSSNSQSHLELKRVQVQAEHQK